MNLDLYSSEFRNFKYLKSNYHSVIFYRKSAELINRVQPWPNSETDITFQWSARVEFFEQILDLANDTIYIVEPGNLNHTNLGYNYEIAKIYTLDKPFLYKGNLLEPINGIPVTLEDIPLLESNYTNKDYFICSEDHKVDRLRGNIMPVSALPIIRDNYISLGAIFYDKVWAVRYQQALTEFFRKNTDSISTISRLL